MACALFATITSLTQATLLATLDEQIQAELKKLDTHILQRENKVLSSINALELGLPVRELPTATVEDFWRPARSLLLVRTDGQQMRDLDWRAQRIDRIYRQARRVIMAGRTANLALEAMREEHQHYRSAIDEFIDQVPSKPYNLYAICGALWIGFICVVLIAVPRKREAPSAKKDPVLENESGRSMADVTLESISDGVIAIDKNTHVTYINPTAQTLTGWDRKAAMGKLLREVFHICSSEVSASMTSPEAQTLREGEVVLYQGNTLIITRAGETVAIDSIMSPIRNRVGDILGAVVTFRDVTRERDLSRKLVHQARHDPLTGLYNRNEFEVRLNRLYHSTRNRRRAHALLYIDLDQFKVVNDTCGHLAGDALLKQLGSILKNEVRAEDTLARLGGDEFGVLLESSDEDQAKFFAEKVLYNIQSFRFSWENKTFTVGASIGLVTISHQSQSVTAILAAADSACYAAKDSGRNRVVVYNEANYKLAQRDGEMQWVSRISQALEENSFSLYFQSIVPINNPRKDGNHYEVLLRLETPESSISAGAFLPAAERYNLMGNLDRWVLSRTLLWLHKHPTHLNALDTCSINLSGQSIGDDNFLKFVSEQFQIIQIPPQKICFEITETAIISDLSNAINFISTLKALGCQFALDDFGSGLSSFGYLRDLEVDYLKIDGVFIKDMMNNPIDMAMVKSISEIGHVMKKKIVAEYVESLDMVPALKECGVDFLQGYAIDSPQPIDSMIDGADDTALSA